MSLETLEAKVDTIAETLAGLRGELKGTIHFFPCAASEERVKELEEKHIRPLEDWRERVRGILLFIGALATAGAILGGLQILLTFL